MSQKTINVGIIGYGYWGPNLVRNFFTSEYCKVIAVADPRSERLKQLQKSYPQILGELTADAVINNPQIDAVVIATPIFTHFELAKACLNMGKHVLLEKPMTSTVEEAKILIELAQRNNLTLMVDHTFLYTGAVQKMRELIDLQTLGNIKYVDSTRINLGLFQPDINVLWDLAPHDISILNFLVKERPVSVNATGVSHTNNDIENIAYLTLNYNSDFIAHFNCSWTSPVKIRTMLIGGNQKMIVFNDLEPTEKIKIYDTGYEHRTEEEKTRILVDYRTGDVFIPNVKNKEALSGMAADFINSILEGKAPLSSAAIGLEVVKILEASDKSIKNKGKEIKIQ